MADCRFWTTNLDDGLSPSLGVHNPQFDTSSNQGQCKNILRISDNVFSKTNKPQTGWQKNPIWISHCCHRMVDGAKFWISSQQSPFFSSFGHWKLNQNLAPSTFVWHQCHILMVIDPGSWDSSILGTLIQDASYTNFVVNFFPVIQ